MSIPKNCRECGFSATCTNPAPYGMYRCIHKKEIERRAAEALLRNNKEVDKHE